MYVRSPGPQSGSVPLALGTSNSDNRLLIGWPAILGFICTYTSISLQVRSPTRMDGPFFVQFLQKAYLSCTPNIVLNIVCFIVASGSIMQLTLLSWQTPQDVRAHYDIGRPSKPMKLTFPDVVPVTGWAPPRYCMIPFIASCIARTV